MKKLAMFTMGTRGDVQPYIYLARALQKAGYEVVLGSHPCWQAFIEKADVRFVPVGPDIDIEKEAASIRGKFSNPAISMLKTMRFVFNMIQNATSEIYEACKGKDLIIVTHSQMGATEAEALGIPTVHVTLQTELIPEKLKPQKWHQKVIGSMIGGFAVRPYNKIRKVYGLPKLKSSDEIISKELNLIPVSRYVKERSPYWEKQHVLTGYWYEDEPDYKPDDRLKEFLKKGDKPIILALGAMSFEDKSEKEKLDMFVNAFQKTGYRAVIQGFQKTLQSYKLPETMFACGSVPHSWLLKQGCFVIHHCGFGTAAATMIFGVPSIPVPHVLDQMGFARQLYDINVAVKPLMAKELSEERIIDAIEEMKRTYDEKRKNVEELSYKVRSEEGLARAVQLITAVLNK
ncbi:MAG: glycosyltransferase [Christensenellales bacterium]|jgi:sterol 3beta-glucosyltransferase